MERHEEESGGRGLPVGHVLSDTSDRRTALLALAAAAVALAVIVGLGLAADDPSLLLLSVLGVVALVAVGLAWFKVRVWAGWSNPQLFLPSSEPLRLGDAVTARIRRTARGRSDVTGLQMSAAIRVEERVEWEERKHNRPNESMFGRTETQRASKVVYEAPVGVTLGPENDRTVEAELALEVPLFEAPPTMDLRHNEIVWELVVSIEAPNAPDDVSSFALIVAPEVAQRLQAGGSGR